MTAPLDALIVKLEAATAEDMEENACGYANCREWDVDIFRLLGLTEQQEAHCRDWCQMDGRTDLTRDDYLRAWAPDYCRSLDAALMLVPEGAAWHVRRDYEDLNRASVYICEDGPPLFIQADAATPALALCIAALKARAA